MSQASLQRKQEALMRAAHTRVQAVDSFYAARRGVAARVSQVSAAGKAIGYTAAAGAGLVLTLSLLRLVRRYSQGAAAAPRVVNPWSALAAQAVSVLVLPLLQGWLLDKKSRFRMPSVKMPSITVPKMPVPPAPSDMFYRWLGLEK